MSDKLNEQLSALVDDELPAGEHALLLERLSRDRPLRERFGRYQMISDVLNNGGVAPMGHGVAERVMAALADEPAHAGAATQTRWRTLLKPVAGVAVAASVALMALFAVQSVNRQAAPVPQLAAGSAPLPATVTVADGQWSRQVPQVRDRLNGYLVNHNEYAASSGVQGVLPYVRIVGYDSESE